MTAVLAEALGDLGGELTGGAQDQGAARPAVPCLGAARETVEHGKGERGGLAGARLGDAEQVAAGEHAWDGLLLDRSRLGVVFGCQRLEDRRGQAKVRKLGQWIGSFS